MNATASALSPASPVIRRVGIFLPLLVVFGITAPMIVFLAMMQMNGWKAPVVGMQGAASSRPASKAKVILFASANSHAFYSKIGGNYETLLKPWRDYFKDRAIAAIEVKNVAELNKHAEGTLVVPSALSLSADERAAILSFRNKGGGILGTWAIGTRDDSGNWAGWQFLESLGFKSTGEIPPDSESRHLVLTGEAPVSYRQAAGTRIWMGQTTEALLRFTGESVAARFMNWARVTEEERRDEGAIVFREAEPQVGRTVMFAFSETCWESRPLLARQVIDDTLKWLSRQPSILIAAWPNAKRSAQIIEMDTEQGFENASAFADMMKSIGYRATFYVLTSVATQFPDLLRSLGRDFEVGYHGDVHTSFKDQPAPLQEQRILKMQSDLSSVLSDTSVIKGFRAPIEGYDATTERLLFQNGIRHHAADPNRLEGRLPSLAKVGEMSTENSLVILPRTQRDDINLYWEKLDLNQTQKALINDFDLAVDTGALGFLSVHSQNFGTNSVLRQVMPAFLEHVREAKGANWLASSGEVAQWWRDRARVRLSSEMTGNRLDFYLTIEGNEPVDGLTLTVIQPQKGQLPTIRSTKIGAPSAVVAPLDRYRTAITFGSLAPGNYAYQITFLN